jgi:thioredoxin reductase
MADADFDVVVVGGGPAGLSAALWLGRYRRRVRVYDAGRPRNEASRAVHGFPGLPDLTPEEFRERLRAQATGVGAELVDAEVRRIEGAKDAFRVVTGDGTVTARRILLAFGRRDELPDVPGLRDLYGRFAHHCPDCEGPEIAGTRVAMLGHDREAARMALVLRTWAKSVVLVTNGRDPDVSDDGAAVLRRYEVAVRRERVVRADAPAGTAVRLELDGAEPLEVDAVFFHQGTRPSCDLAAQLGCERDELGHVPVNRARQTTVDGVYAAGDLVGIPYLVINAAAEGVHAALAMHRSLLPPECEL